MGLQIAFISDLHVLKEVLGYGVAFFPGKGEYKIKQHTKRALFLKPFCAMHLL